MYRLTIEQKNLDHDYHEMFAKSKHYRVHVFIGLLSIFLIWTIFFCYAIVYIKKSVNIGLDRWQVGPGACSGMRG
jgi:hypothetical protein